MACFIAPRIQSGGGGVAIEAAEAAAQPLELLNQLGLKPENARELLNLSTETLTAAFFEAFAATRFTYSRPVIDGKVLPRHPFWPDAPAPHALDVPLFFDNVACAGAMFGGDIADPQHIADQMSDALIAFARSGNPQSAILPDWPAYKPQKRATMVFDVVSDVEDDHRPWARELFEGSM